MPRLDVYILREGELAPQRGHLLIGCVTCSPEGPLAHWMCHLLTRGATCSSEGSHNSRGHCEKTNKHKIINNLDVFLFHYKHSGNVSCWNLCSMPPSAELPPWTVLTVWSSQLWCCPVICGFFSVHTLHLQFPKINKCIVLCCFSQYMCQQGVVVTYCLTGVSSFWQLVNLSCLLFGGNSHNVWLLCVWWCAPRCSLLPVATVD